MYSRVCVSMMICFSPDRVTMIYFAFSSHTVHAGWWITKLTFFLNKTFFFTFKFYLPKFIEFWISNDHWKRKKMNVHRNAIHLSFCNNWRKIKKTQTSKFLPPKKSIWNARLVFYKNVSFCSSFYIASSWSLLL